MSLIRLVDHAEFCDEKNLLITSGIEGVFIFKFRYESKYNPETAEKVDPQGIYIKISLLNKQPI